MQEFKNLINYLCYGFIVGFLAIASCNEVENPGIDEPDNSTELNANEIQSSIILQDARTKEGNIPPPSDMTVLKNSRDSLWFLDGLKNRIRILHPDKGFVSGSTHFYIQVEGADKYLETKAVEEESNDSIAVFYMEFDSDGFEPPLSFNITIAPHDGSGVPIDHLEMPVEIEEKGGGSCSPSSPNPDWDWIYTYSEGKFFPAPGYGYITEASVNGCCMEGYTVDCIPNQIPERDWISMDYISSRIYNYETLQFAASEFVGILDLTIQNIDPSESDFCNGSPDYNISKRDNIFWGDYTYNPSNGRVQLANIEVRSQDVYLEELGMTFTEYDMCFLNENFLYEIVSCHFLMETSFIEGTTYIRVFERRGDRDTEWY